MGLPGVAVRLSRERSDGFDSHTIRFFSKTKKVVYFVESSINRRKRIFFESVFKNHTEPSNVTIIHLESHPFLPRCHIAILYSEQYTPSNQDVVPMIVPVWSDDKNSKCLEGYHLKYNPYQNDLAKDVPTLETLTKTRMKRMIFVFMVAVFVSWLIAQRGC